MTPTATEKLLAALRQQNVLLDRIAVALERQAAFASPFDAANDIVRRSEHNAGTCLTDCQWCRVEADAAAFDAGRVSGTP